MSEHDNTQYDCKDLPGCGNEGKDVLLEIAHDVVDTHLTEHLQYDH
jgi:hypothetical protein